MEGAWRSFEVRADPGRTLKELVLGRNRGGPPRVRPNTSSLSERPGSARTANARDA